MLAYCDGTNPFLKFHIGSLLHYYNGLTEQIQGSKQSMHQARAGHRPGRAGGPSGFLRVKYSDNCQYEPNTQGESLYVESTTYVEYCTN